ncbi:MAG: chemotaxis protein CheW [Holophagaceae bacterium]
MPETAVWLQVEAAGQHLLLSPADVLEVLPLMAIQPLPGASRGIEGVVLHNGAFLPVLAWRDLPACDGPSPPPSLLVVLRRFGLPVVRVVGMVALPEDAWESEPEELARGWSGGRIAQGQGWGRKLEPERLLGLLRELRAKA